MDRGIMDTPNIHYCSLWWLDTPNIHYCSLSWLDTPNIHYCSLWWIPLTYITAHFDGLIPLTYITAHFDGLIPLTYITAHFHGLGTSIKCGRFYYINQDLDFHVMVFFVFSGLRWEAIVHFVDIGGIVDHHCLNFL